MVKTSAIAAMLGSVSASLVSDMVYHHPQYAHLRNEDGHIELDVQMAPRHPSAAKPGLHNYLVNSSRKTLIEQPHKKLLNQDLMNLTSEEAGDYIEKDLDSFFNIQIYANMYIGADKQEFPLIFDSGSSWVWVGSDLCASCANPAKFVPKQSPTYTQKTSKLSELNYGRGTAVGWDSTDTICLRPESSVGHGCMENFLFKNIIYQESLGGLHGAGLIGLAPSTQYSGSQLFVPSLFDAGAIKHNLFAMFIDNEGQSKIQMGGYNTEKFARGPMFFHKINSPMFWNLPLGDVWIGGEPYIPHVKAVMADTGTSMNLIPDEDFNPIMQKFVYSQGMSCWKMQNTLTACHCTEVQHASVPDINFQLDGQDMVIPRDMWFEKSGDTCVAKFMHHPGRNEWILGLNFFNNYYTVFDYGNNSIGFAESKNFGRKAKNGFVSQAVAGGGKAVGGQPQTPATMQNLIQNVFLI